MNPNYLGKVREKIEAIANSNPTTIEELSAKTGRNKKEIEKLADLLKIPILHIQLKNQKNKTAIIHKKKWASIMEEYLTKPEKRLVKKSSIYSIWGLDKNFELNQIASYKDLSREYFDGNSIVEYVSPKLEEVLFPERSKLTPKGHSTLNGITRELGISSKQLVEIIEFNNIPTQRFTSGDGKIDTYVNKDAVENAINKGNIVPDDWESCREIAMEYEIPVRKIILSAKRWMLNPKYSDKIKSKLDPKTGTDVIYIDPETVEEIIEALE